MNNSKHIDVSILADKKLLPGFLDIPERATGLVVFVHGSGSSRLSPRNAQVAGIIRDSGIATLLFDLLTEKEDKIYATRFDIDLLVRRLTEVLDWLKESSPYAPKKIGLFGSSTGAAAALRVAALKPDNVAAVVSRGGRTDLSNDLLIQITTPTLFIVGGADYEVLSLNKESYQLLGGTKKLVVINGATHLFEEAGALEKVAKEVTNWFKKYLV